MQRCNFPPTFPTIGKLTLGFLLAAASVVPTRVYGQAVLPPEVDPANESIASKPAMVLQNRFFNKALRPEISLFGGTVLNEAYAKTLAAGIRAGIFINEYIGFDYSYIYFNSTTTDDYSALQSLEFCKESGCEEKVKVKPSFVTLKSQHALLATFAPIYGKINLLDRYILYSDIYLSAGAGLLKTSDGTKFPLILGLGQRFYFAKDFNVRIDAWNHTFGESRINQGQMVQSTRNAWLVAIGVSMFFNRIHE